MERLILEADTKFDEKFKQVQQRQQANISVFVDRTFNLRQQIAHNSALTGDEHFMELLVETEKYLSPEYASTARSEAEKRLYTMLAGLLKSLLRESVAVTAYAARKVQIEMIYQWFEDKKSQIFKWELSCEKKNESQDPKIIDGELSHAVDDHSVGAAVEPCSSQVERPRSRFASRMQAACECADPVDHQPCKPLTFTAEESRKREVALITNKLSLYKKRNLQKAEQYRADAKEKGGSHHEMPVSNVRVIYKKDSTTTKTAALDLPSAAFHAGPCGSPGLLHSLGAQAPVFDPSKKALQMTLDEALANTQRHWVTHVVRRMEEERDSKVMNDCLTGLAFHQARVDEESSRRLESCTFGSQTGRVCHTILRREPKHTGEGAEDRVGMVTAASQLPSKALDKERAMEMLHKVTYTGSDSTSLSPYDDYQPTALDERRLQELLSVVNVPDRCSDSARERHGLKGPHPTSVAATSLCNTRLDVSVTGETKTVGTQPRTDVPVMQLLFPALKAEEDVPSLRQLEQMRVVDRIRECFARMKTKDGKGFHVPRSVIEAALITPDDRPYDECLRLLPRPGSSLPHNPNAPKDAKGSKKKKVGKKK